MVGEKEKIESGKWDTGKRRRQDGGGRMEVWACHKTHTFSNLGQNFKVL